MSYANYRHQFNQFALLAIATALVHTAVSCSGNSHVEQPQSIELANSIVRVCAPTIGGKGDFFSTGFFVGDRQIVATCYHGFLKNAASPEFVDLVDTSRIVVRPLKHAIAAKARIVFADSAKDIIILSVRLRIRDLDSLGIFPVQCDTSLLCRIGTPIFCIGAAQTKSQDPSGFHFALQKSGKIASFGEYHYVDSVAKPFYFVADMFAAPGMSGSAIFELPSCRLIGMASNEPLAILGKIEYYPGFTMCLGAVEVLRSVNAGLSAMKN